MGFVNIRLEACCSGGDYERLADCGFAVVVKLSFDKLEDERRFPDGRFAEQDEFPRRRDRGCSCRWSWC